MTLTTYIKFLQKLEKKYGNKQVMYAIDEEGNDYKPIEFKPAHHEYIEGACEDYKDVVVIN